MFPVYSFRSEVISKGLKYSLSIWSTRSVRNCLLDKVKALASCRGDAVVRSSVPLGEPLNKLRERRKNEIDVLHSSRCLLLVVGLVGCRQVQQCQVLVLFGWCVVNNEERQLNFWGVVLGKRIDVTGDHGKVFLECGGVREELMDRLMLCMRMVL